MPAVLNVNGGQWGCNVMGDDSTVVWSTVGQSRGLNATGIVALLAVFSAYYTSANVTVATAPAWLLNVRSTGGTASTTNVTDARSLAASVIAVLQTPGNNL